MSQNQAGASNNALGKMMGHDYPVIRGVGVELGGGGGPNNVRLRLFLPLYLRVHR